MDLWNGLVPELLVQDFAVSRKFYTEILGFSVRYERSSPPFGYFERDGVQLMLEEDHPDAWRTDELKPPLGRGVNFQMELVDTSDIEKQLAKAQHPYFRKPQKTVYAVDGEAFEQREFLIQDPDGYLLRLVQLRPDDAVRQMLLGVWDVESFTYTDETGTHAWRSEVTGQLLYEAGGHMSLAINSAIDGDHPWESIFFYSGTFTVKGDSVTHNVKNASNPERIGQQLVRRWSLQEDRLSLYGSDAFGTGQIGFVRASDS